MFMPTHNIHFQAYNQHIDTKAISTICLEAQIQFFEEQKSSFNSQIKAMISKYNFKTKFKVWISYELKDNEKSKDYEDRILTSLVEIQSKPNQSTLVEKEEIFLIS